MPRRNRLALQIAAMMMSPSDRAAWFLRNVPAPDFASEALAEFAEAAIGRKEDSHALADLAARIHVMLNSGQQRLDFCYLVCEAGLSGPLVRGAVISHTWVDGKLGSPLRVAGYSLQQILDWFTEASPETVMKPADQAALAGLPEMVAVWRGAPVTPLAQARAALSWTLDRGQAEWFADGHARRTGRAILLEATIPRSAIVAYLDEGGRREREAIVDWRRLRAVQQVAEVKAENAA